VRRHLPKIAATIGAGLIGFVSGFALVSAQVAPLSLSVGSTVSVSDADTVAPPLQLSLSSTVNILDSQGVHPPLALAPSSTVTVSDVNLVAVDLGPQTFLVNSTDDLDDGTCNATHCSLREAITQANSNLSALFEYTDIIAFDIPGDGPHVIQQTSELPAITEPVVIDGTTEPDFKRYPIVEIDGTNAGGVSGLTLASNDNTIRGLAITNFSGDGIVVSAGGGNTITRNSIRNNGGLPVDLGNDGQDSNDAGDSDTGVNGGQNFPVLTSADVSLAGTTIEGTLNAVPSQTYHIELFASVGTSDADVLFHAFDVTTDANGDAPLSVSLLNKYPAGESITATATDSNGNTSEVSTFVKATGLYTVNTIADSRTSVIECDPTNCAFGDALELANVDGRDSVITFNIPGPAPHVVEAELVSGLPVAEAPVVIDGTTQPGYDGSPVIELDWQGDGGLFVHGGSSLIRGLAMEGGTTAVLSIQFGSGNVIQGNYLGTDVTGTLDRGSNDYGVKIEDGSSDNLIGGTEPGQGNLIAFNQDGGVGISGSATLNNTIVGNRMISNGGPGIEYLFGAANNAPTAPTLTSAIVGSAIFEGSLTGDPDTSYRIELFSSDSCDVQGGTPVGAIDVTTGPDGTVDFTASFDTVIPVGHFITATATSPNGTSPFSECQQAVSAPLSTDVNTTSDTFDGRCTVVHCSLRERIFDINLMTGPDTLTFNIPTTTDPGYDPNTGVFTIRPLTPLPQIGDEGTVDGYSQP